MTPTPHSSTARRFAALLTAVAACAGCNNSPFEADVSGTITLDGAPVAPGVVIFSPTTSGDGSSRGNIEGGSYFLRTRHERGIDPGSYRVSVRVFEKGEPPGPGERQMAILAPLVPERYLTPETSGLEFDVQPGPNRIDIELTTDPSGG